METRIPQLKIREEELSQLVYEIADGSLFMETEISLNSIDISKIVVSGHSFGGITAFRAMQINEKVKAAITFDPWLYVHIESVF